MHRETNTEEWQKVPSKSSYTRRRERDSNKNTQYRPSNIKSTIRTEDKRDGTRRGYILSSDKQFPSLGGDDVTSERAIANAFGFVSDSASDNSTYRSNDEPLKYHSIIEKQHLESTASNDSGDEYIRRKYTDGYIFTKSIYDGIISQRRAENDTKNYRNWIELYSVELSELYDLMNGMCIKFLKLPKESKISYNHFLSFAYFNSSGRCPKIALKTSVV